MTVADLTARQVTRLHSVATMTDMNDTPTPTAQLPIESQVRHRVTDSGVAWITLDRPDVKNAISPDQRNRVIDLLDEASASWPCAPS